MKYYYSIDIETTGISPDSDQILEIGIVVEEVGSNKPLSELYRFKSIVMHPRYEGSAYAIMLNERIWKMLANRKEYEEHGVQFNDFYDIPKAIKTWLDNIPDELKEYDNGRYKLVCAGKNVGTFDYQFLKRLPNWNKYFIPTVRFIDPAMLYLDWKIDNSLPSLSDCKKRANLDELVTHDSIEDAWDVIQVMRPFYNK